MMLIKLIILFYVNLVHMYEIHVYMCVVVSRQSFKSLGLEQRHKMYGADFNYHINRLAISSLGAAAVLVAKDKKSVQLV